MAVMEDYAWWRDRAAVSDTKRKYRQWETRSLQKTRARYLTDIESAQAALALIEQELARRDEPLDPA